MTTPDTPNTPLPVCQCCPRNLFTAEVEQGRTVCRPCERRLDSEITEVTELWAQLPALLRPGAGGGDGGDAPRAPGPSGSRPPASLAVLSLIGGGVTDPLLAEEDAWRRALGVPPRPLNPCRYGQDRTLTDVTGWLRAQLPWACRSYPDVDDLDRALRKLLAEMRGLVTGDRRRREELTPACPNRARGYADGDEDAPACGGQLTYDPRKSVIRCGACRRAYGPADWISLGVAAGAISLPFIIPAA